MECITWMEIILLYGGILFLRVIKKGKVTFRLVTIFDKKNVNRSLEGEPNQIT